MADERNHKVMLASRPHGLPAASDFAVEDESPAPLADGQVRLDEHVEQGIDRFGDALRMLFTGGHIGKLLVAV